ncbi:MULTISPECIES: cobyrinate a,c-diamide synthase [Thermus]|jgi:cobyrinic acid a,c-diamide synthase|uniref:Cobyrinate a,c-diamide synthase n=1 Tax=Thermus brockianus TaxID=56956 RepID=A0A1J0LYP5_THEBO|nr:cobyrinate a,c-diamide synthase [Thermus brockianus]APD10581.1 cobyrinic acid a,c-diamide synthase [Thermus brockianus]BDG17530.1 cobyrinic acid a,c-diamide synthase [Thermus brockianus]
MRLLLAAPHSGAGKTTLSLALALALRERGLRVQAFKVGPDYIDPTHLEAATGRRPYNLDGFFLDEGGLLALFRHGARGADFALVEGVMGLFDGKDPVGRVGSTAQVARLLRLPVALVVDAKGMAGSIAALVRGFRDHDPEVPLVGVFANRVGSERHAELLKEALAPLGLPLLGWLPQDPALALPERHLGLVLAGEVAPPLEALRRAFRVDLEATLRLAGAAPPLPEAPSFLPERRPPRVRLAYAWDRAFRFYYPEALELLEALGAELVPFSPLEDEALPEAEALLLGGGYPELFAERLSANRAMREAIRRFPGPVVAECGGYMYLSQGLWVGEAFYPMVGLVPGEARMAERPVLGYREVEALQDNPLARRGEVYKGHEFHYARLPQSPSPAWRRVGGEEVEGYADGRVLASFVHLYLPARPEGAERLLECARAGGAPGEGWA